MAGRSGQCRQSIGRAWRFTEVPLAMRSLDLALCVARRVSLGYCVPFVVQPPPACQRQLDLDAAVLQVHRERHQREGLLSDAAGDLVDLLAMEKKLAAPVRSHGTKP